MPLASHPFWPELFQPGIPLAEKAVRTVAVYLFLLAGLRLAGKRELAQLNAFDLVVLLLLSNTLQNAVIGNDDSLAGGLFGAAVLLVLNHLVVRFLYAHPAADAAVEGQAELLVEHGAIREEALARNLITRAELEAAARRQGLESLDEVQSCRLEVGGAITFARRVPTEEERRHAELLARLDALERRLSPPGGG